MAEREGFEPSKQLPVYTLSKRAPSTTRPPLQKNERCVIIKDIFVLSYYSKKHENRHLN